MFFNGFKNTPQPLSGSVIHRLKTSTLDALYSQDIHSLIPADWNSGNRDVTLNFYKQTPAVLTCKMCWLRAYWASNSMPGKDRTDIPVCGIYST